VSLYAIDLHKFSFASLDIGIDIEKHFFGALFDFEFLLGDFFVQLILAMKCGEVFFA
jgi:hypothetical protein